MYLYINTHIQTNASTIFQDLYVRVNHQRQR